jgi:SAM-dependent methyltransferase
MQHVRNRPGLSPGTPADSAAPRIGILVVAYNAASTLAKVLDRVPLSFRPRVTQVFVCDDASQDSTYLVGLGYKQITADMPLTVIRHGRTLGYGGIQKAGYRLAIEQGLDIVVLLHGNGEYAPESLGEMTGPLERGECDAVLGSRMLARGAARRGGMPAYKYVGNKILTRFENRVLGTRLSELHSGYRAYSVKALASVPFERNSDGYDFDTQLLIQLMHAGKRIVEVPIPTYYGDEIRHVNGLKYAAEVSGDVLRYWAAKRGLLADSVVEIGPEYELKGGEGGSHAVVQRWLRRMPPARVLDLGCSSGLLAERIRSYGHRVTGVDLMELPGVRGRVDHFVRADLDQGLPAGLDVDGGYDVVIAADVLEHLRAPQRLLEQIRGVLSSRGTLIASVPNLGHWYSRGRIALGLFDYDQRGILDATHVRFFTRRSFRRCLHQAGFTVLREEATGLPLEVMTGGRGPLARVARLLDRVAVGLRPTLFAYQFVCQCERSAQGAGSGGWA